MSFWKNLFFKSEEPPMKHIALVLPAKFPSLSISVPEPNAHCTIMYLGTTDTVEFTAQDVIDALGGPILYGMLWARVTHAEKFGPDKNVPVLRVEHDMLQRLNRDSTEILAKVGISDPSIYADAYKPHVTVSETTFESPPHAVLLTEMELWWAGERMKLL